MLPMFQHCSEHVPNERAPNMFRPNVVLGDLRPLAQQRAIMGVLSKFFYYITALIVFRIITVIFRFFAFGDTFFRPTAGRRTI